MDNLTYFQSVLDTIRKIIERYASDEVLHDDDLKEMHRKLSANMYFLNEFRIEFKKDWDNHWHNCEKQTNASKERSADKACSELYMSRKLYDAAENVLISINNQLKY